MSKVGPSLGAAALLALAGCGPSPRDPESQVGPDPYLPPIHQYLVPPMRLAKVIGWQPGQAPMVAPGLQIKALATGLRNPRSVYGLPNGDILVVETQGPSPPPVRRPKEFVMNWMESLTHSATRGGNRILLLRDANGDGVPELQSVLIDRLHSPFGVVLVGNDLYVANTDAVLRFPYQTGQTRIAAPGTKLCDLPGGPIDHHWTKSLTASPDGTKLYAGVGSNSNITENGIEAEKNRAAIWEIDRATGEHRLFATGLRNPNGLTFEPQSHVLWAVVNERDEFGPDLVPDYLTSVKEGAFYGWPYSYWGQHVDPRVRPRRSDLVARATVPDYSLASHVAPLGLVFYTAANLPAIYRGGAFVGEHGSWNRQVFSGYKVVYVPFVNGRPNGKAQDVVTGFLDGHGGAHGRPVALAVDSRGGLLIADDVGNTVWRVTGAGGN
ncbi:sorbosone dehydrogenase family protein [Phenylobacterium sp.]|jgi:glucose/arabinose dehydrogenase|uniref:PQQ-dependent sugar dehydrogenase n=1 Tax=Phenylobacterium sp. TaxID=1871053 RepID=UPI002E3079E4|nr:sorbosone dehydrogenase family protein [Phenylobacterium sp.]HEX4712519.1 sorbosone dehydrogenase family protein [Phenylobacterium sp.]